MPETLPRELHLHTLDSLFSDLISGVGVLVTGQALFTLPDDETRSVLAWYRERGLSTWAANISVAQCDELVERAKKPPPSVSHSTLRRSGSCDRRLALLRVVIHRFAGIHKFGSPSEPPDDYIHEFRSSLTLFEGRNGSGKTSLLSAIAWALTGEIFRPQREPEMAAKDFECSIGMDDADTPASTHRISPVTPLPAIDRYRPDMQWIPADTWVELHFVDQDGVVLPPVRRSLTRTASGKLVETPPELGHLGVDPISLRIGTLMPALLSRIQVGEESELGQAVAQLTGLSGLVDLSDHARRAKQKIDRDLVGAKVSAIAEIDRAYLVTRTEAQEELSGYPELARELTIPLPSDGVDLVEELTVLVRRIEEMKAGAFASVVEVLGADFDPRRQETRASLENSIGPAISELEQVARLPALVRLQKLRELSSSEIAAAAAKIAELLGEAEILLQLAANPTHAARVQLYARVASWLAENPTFAPNDDKCAVCGSEISEAVDPVTGKSVRAHIDDAKRAAELLAQTLGKWAQAVTGHLSRQLPEALRIEIGLDLPPHPCDLIRTAIVEELFAASPFRGALSSLKDQTASVFDKVVESRSQLEVGAKVDLPPSCAALARALLRLDRAIRFAKWRQASEPLAREILSKVLGRRTRDSDQPASESLLAKLLSLDGTVKSAKPLTNAIVRVNRLLETAKRRKNDQERLAAYRRCSQALGNLLPLGELAYRQVDQLRVELRDRAATWRAKVYRGAFPSTAQELVDTPLGRNGELGLTVRSAGVSAPAQHVSNASALRASLVGFFLAFWEHLLTKHGGLRILIFDDPQELLDEENRRRLADSFSDLAKAGAQLIVASYDSRFSQHVSCAPGLSSIEHLAVHPATELQPTVRTVPSVTELTSRRARFEKDPNDEESARNFVDGSRVYLEAVLGDLFDDPAYATWVRKNPWPTLDTFIARLKPLVKGAGNSMFAGKSFVDFIGHAGLQDGSSLRELMNKSHHGRRGEIRASDVVACQADIASILELAERMFEESLRWRRRDEPREPQVRISVPEPLCPSSVPKLSILLCPDLAAFTHDIAQETQATVEPFDDQLLAGNAFYLLRRDNFGFAAPEGAIAIVECMPKEVADRRLVVARTAEATYARRLVRGKDTDLVALTADTPDPRRRAPKTLFVSAGAVALHQVAGVLFEHDIVVAQGNEEAVMVDAGATLSKVEIAFRVRDESAVPLALSGQIVLGGQSVAPRDLKRLRGSLVALSLNDGSTVFKRVGLALPNSLGDLHQFESIGGLGSSFVASIGGPVSGLSTVVAARLVLGVLYNG